MTTSGFVQAGDYALEYTFEPPASADAPVILLLHEGLGCAQLWGQFRAALAKATGAGVFAYSREGYGASTPIQLPRPLDYMRQHTRNVLPKVIAGIDAARIVLVGHSDGATIAALYGAAQPDPRVRGTVLIAPHFFVEDFSIREIAKTKAAYETTDLREKLARWHKDVDGAFRGWNDVWLNPHFPQALEMRSDLASLRMPVLAIQGAEDQYGTVAQIDALDQALTTTGTQHERLLLPNVRHTPHREASAETISAIKNFTDHLDAA
ncbi:Lysophospholipase, alpha-beta hydrolase superfamily [Beijerinckia sp. 28-YEA-48]|nr:Lysophospholipase, alpha-beta hydrolase superfamily [Beijerinckia sp. 28-YEA-48]